MFRTRELGSRVWQAARIPEMKAVSWPLFTQLILNFFSSENYSGTSGEDGSPARVFFVFQRAQHGVPHDGFGRLAAYPVFPLRESLRQKHLDSGDAGDLPRSRQPQQFGA